MPKLKTKKSVAKRITKRTKTGLLQVSSMSAQHRTTGKSSRVQRASRKKRNLNKANSKRLRKLVPYL